VKLPKSIVAGPTSIQCLSGDLWILANAYWDPLSAAFGFQIQGTGFIPGEPELGYFVAGATMWVASPQAYTLIRNGGSTANPRYAGVGGWELGWTTTQERNWTLGGMGIEVDGSGTFPYGRFVHNTTGTVLARKCTGTARNLYVDMADMDDEAKDSWFMGYVEQYNPADGTLVAGSEKLTMAYIPAQAAPPGTWFDVFAVDKNGMQYSRNRTVAQLPAAAMTYRGCKAFVSDCTVNTFRAVVAGGGGNAVPVHCDGSFWRVG
jgi:hypothetical protein